MVKDGNPCKSNRRAKIRNPSGQDSQVWKPPLPHWAMELPSALLPVGWFARVGHQDGLIVGEPSGEPGHWPTRECSCIQRADLRGGKTNRRERTVITRHRSSRYMRILWTVGLGCNCSIDNRKDHGLLRSGPIYSTLCGYCHDEDGQKARWCLGLLKNGWLAARGVPGQNDSSSFPFSRVPLPDCPER